ncbi:MAG: 2Fe-2S iron-sulfur cluster binding domain-containing protein [Treponema sp.]|nr:2Fe-2S iron-sulfur cluster binding domain-containing protein [Treponema sp.]
MKIPLTLNSNKLILDCAPEESLLSVLRNQGCLSVKTGCAKGYCGSCTVLLDGNPVPSCKIPVSIIKGSEIITLEYFTKTEEYNAIISGFKKADINLCGYCNSAKIFAAYQVLCLKQNLTREDIAVYLKNLAPCCTDLDTLINGIIYAMKAYNTSNKN